MTHPVTLLDLPRPAPSADAGPLDERLYDLVEARVRRLAADNPILATGLGIHEHDHLLGDASRDAVLDEIAAEREHLAAVEALDPAALSGEARFERDLELHNVRLNLFESRRGPPLGASCHRRRRPGRRGVPAVRARSGPARRAPGADRGPPRGGAGVPARVTVTRAEGPQVSTWQQTEARYAADLPSLFAEVRAAAAPVLDERALARLDRAIDAANVSLEAHAAWIRETLEHASDDWPLGSERYDELVRLRAFGDLDADAILEIGHEQLRLNLEARRAAARELDPDADLATVIDRLKHDHPATFDEALDGYRDVMARSRAYLIEHDLVSVPDDETIEVMATPEYLRSVMPFAAYFSPARFDADQRGLYIVTPAVDDDPNAMLEHYRASISNTSIHEAYPGHHLQLAVAAKHPSLTRMLTDAPEFVEGWGMYSEQMMREQGFDAGPAFRTAMYTDAVWRACRIILDVRMHRGELTPEAATDFLVEHTSFETANARAEVRRYTYTPGYQLSYLLGKVLILGLREEEQRRRGAAFSLKAFHDTLLRNGSLPIAFHRRLLRGEG